ncbi:MAG: hypothetical protein Fur0018_24600 [Anaerolineales bacterium]
MTQDIEQLFSLSHELLATVNFWGAVQVSNTAFRRLFHLDEAESERTLFSVFALDERQSLRDALDVLPTRPPGAGTNQYLSGWRYAASGVLVGVSLPGKENHLLHWKFS